MASAVRDAAERSNDSQRELSRHNSTQASSGGTPVSSTEGDYDEDFEEEEDEDEEEDDEEEEEEVEEGGDASKVHFDERFLAQLLSFDPSAISQNNGNASYTSQPFYSGEKDGRKDQQIGQSSNRPSSSTYPSATSSNLFPTQSSSTTRQVSDSTTPLPPSAPTPSNEFYDGAINFLTEILGSSNPSVWNGGAGMPSPGGDLSWLNQTKTPASTVGLGAPSPQPTKTQFKNIQPLISNLIARIKGLPIQEGEQSGQPLEDDLVVLLQSLMAHRQAQQDRQTQNQLNQSMALLANNTAPSLGTAGTMSGNYDVAPFPIQRVQTTNMANNQTFPSQSGFSIVDFDFGDDDDDPDFVPKNVNLDFANSVDFADALAQVSAAAPLDSMPVDNGQNVATQGQADVQVSDATWQQMMDSLQGPDEVAADKGASTMSPSSRNGFKRTRSTTRQIDLPGEVDDSNNKFGTEERVGSSSKNKIRERDTMEQRDQEDHESGSDEEEDKQDGKRRGRKALSREEALERRRESNRECARRGRARKKQEDEEIRLEFERMRNMRSMSREMGTGGEEGFLSVDTTELPAALRKKKRGRPFGSKSSTNRGEKEAGVSKENGEKVADLMADNRMLRAEMQRLIEENAQLRARMLRFQEDGQKESSRGSKFIYKQSSGSKAATSDWRRKSDYSTRRQRQRIDEQNYSDDHSAHEFGQEEEEEGVDSSDDGVIPEDDFIAKSLASRGLAYDPFKPFNPRPLMKKHSSHQEASSGKGIKRKRAADEDRHDDQEIPKEAVDLIIKGLRNAQHGGASLKNILQAAAQDFNVVR